MPAAFLILVGVCFSSIQVLVDCLPSSEKIVLNILIEISLNEPEAIMLNEISQARKVMYHIMLVISKVY